MELTEAYEMGPLLDAWKARGLDCAEDVVIAAIGDALEWFDKSALMSENPYDDIGRAVAPAMADQLKNLADKINGKVDRPE